MMKLLGNIIWVVFGGLAISLEYMISGILLCCTIIGIPFGIQIFKLAIYALLPFGQTTVTTDRGTGCLNFVMNVLWLLLGGVFIMLSHLVLGVLFCITIVGIPFGLQHFKLMAMAFAPFGKDVVSN